MGSERCRSRLLDTHRCELEYGHEGHHEFHPTRPTKRTDPPVKTMRLAESPLLACLETFRDLEPGWDSYGAQPIDPRAIDKARELLHSLTVVPTARGGVQIEMGSGDETVELDISPSGTVWRIDP